MTESRQTAATPTEIFDSLTLPQREAVSHVDGPLLILAGPGSGKTRVVTHRIAHMLALGTPPGQIVALTFTNKAADEMCARLYRLAPRQEVWLGTFHRFCARLLRMYGSLAGLEENYSIYDTGEARDALKLAIEEAQVELTHVTPERVAHEISFAKNNLIGPDAYQARPGNPVGGLVEQVYPLYQRRMLRANAVDFDDLLLHVAFMLRDNPELRRMLDERFRYILVDEYQDTNFAQYTFVRSLSRDYPNLAVTGDPDQSIYGWRGANLSNILEFERDFPDVRVVRLEQNYRSTKRILHVADTLITNNVRRKHKTLFTENPNGEPVRLVVYPTSGDEVDHIVARIAHDLGQGRRKARDFAIFYRVNWLSRSFEQSLRGAGVPYQIVKGLEFYQRKEIKDVVAYLQLLNNPRHDAAFRRIINTPPRKIGPSTVERLSRYADERQVSLLAAAREAGLIEAIPKRSATHVASFVAMYDRLSLSVGQPLPRVLERVLRETGYIEWLEASDDEDDYERLANIQELNTAASDFEVEHPSQNQLEEFLEQVALVSDTDDWESTSDRVSLMTLHAAKGLEFPVVYIVGAEQGLLPHERSREDPEQLEEERRLLFVGITRAREELQLSYATRRIIMGNLRLRIASEFLLELPRADMEVVSPRTYSPTPESEHDGSKHDENEIVHEEAWCEPDRIVAPTAPRPAVNKVTALMTAAQMMEGGAAALGETAVPMDDRYPPETFQPGMMVRHPIHGIGRILDVSGQGPRRMANIQFFNGTRPIKFVLLYSQLTPVGQGG